MKLYEIEQGERIQLMARLERTSVEYDVTVAFCTQGILCADPVYIEGKILNFTGDQVRISIVYAGNGEQPLVWEGCGIQTIQTKQGKYYAIISQKDGKNWNRRQNFRQYIGIPGLLTIDSTREKRDVMVKDISVGGVSFVENTTAEGSDIGSFHLQFDDRTNKMNVQLAGHVVREEEVEEGKKVFGCIVTRSNVELGSYIAMKQKQELAKHMS